MAKQGCWHKGEQRQSRSCADGKHEGLAGKGLRLWAEKVMEINGRTWRNW